MNIYSVTLHGYSSGTQKSGVFVVNFAVFYEQLLFDYSTNVLVRKGFKEIKPMKMRKNQAYNIPCCEITA